MTQDIQNLRDDIAYLKTLSEEGGRGLPARSGTILFSIGMLYAVAAVVFWADTQHVIPMPALHGWEFGIAGLLQMVMFFWMRAAGYSWAPISAVNRAFAAVWAGLGCGVGGAVLAFIVTAWKLGRYDIWNTFGPLVLILYGAGWFSCAIIAQRRWMFGAALASFVYAVGLAFISGASTYFLAYAGAIFLSICVPGLVLMQAGKKAA